MLQSCPLKWEKIHMWYYTVETAKLGRKSRRLGHHLWSYISLPPDNGGLRRPIIEVSTVHTLFCLASASKTSTNSKRFENYAGLIPFTGILCKYLVMW